MFFADFECTKVFHYPRKTNIWIEWIVERVLKQDYPGMSNRKLLSGGKEHLSLMQLTFLTVLNYTKKTFLYHLWHALIDFFNRKELAHLGSGDAVIIKYFCMLFWAFSPMLICTLTCVNSYSASRNNWCTVGGDGDVGSARYEPALLPPCLTIRVLSCNNWSIFRNSAL